MRICVQGLWHLGSVTAASLASVGHEVVGYDPDPDVVARLSQGVPPVDEPGLSQLMKEGLGAGRLTFAAERSHALSSADVVWVAYDTPVDEDDIADVDYVLGEIKASLHLLRGGELVLVSSQLPVGSIRRLEKYALEQYPSKTFAFACTPENLRLGKALEVFLKPDRIVVGIRHAEDRHRLTELLQPVSDRIEWMSVESAEMTKHAINAFLATSVVFANEIATVCERVGADAKEVERGLKTEARIGPKAYLSPGAAFAGGTLARDIAFLNSVTEHQDLTTPLLGSVKRSNDEHKQWVRRKLQELFGDLAGVSVAVWGLTYKPGTDTLRRSAAVELCNWLLAQGAQVHVHDPAARDLPREWQGKIVRYTSATAALAAAQVLVLATEWPEYRNISGKECRDRPNTLTVLDATRFARHLADLPGVRYLSVGTPIQER